MSSVSERIVNVLIHRISDRLRDAQIASEEDRDWVPPVLNLRKDIWTHFPVVLNPLGNGEDGAERHAVCWHCTNLVAWRTEHPQPESWVDYETLTRRRLLRALTASTKWTVEPAVAPDQICILRMNFRPRLEFLDSSETESAPPVRVPLLLRLNDIKMHFPVVWHSLPSPTPDVKLYALEFHTKKLAMCRKDPGHVRAQLLAALRASTAWTVLFDEEDDADEKETNRNHICRLQIPSARRPQPTDVPML